MSVSRQWLLAGGVAALAAAAATALLYSRYGGAAPPWWPADGRRRVPRRRRLTADAGCASALLLFGLPASGRTALMVRALMSHPDTVAVPREVTDAPPVPAVDPDRCLYQYVTREELRRQLERGRFVEVRERGGHLYGTPADCPATDGDAPAPLCLLKAGLSSLVHLRRPGAGETSCRPLMVWVRVPQRRQQLARLMMRDWLTRDTAETQLGRAEAQLRAALAGADAVDFFDAVIDNDDLDRASDELDRLIDAQLDAGTRMYSARQRLSPQKGRARRSQYAAASSQPS